MASGGEMEAGGLAEPWWRYVQARRKRRRVASAVNSRPKEGAAGGNWWPGRGRCSGRGMKAVARRGRREVKGGVGGGGEAWQSREEA